MNPLRIGYQPAFIRMFKKLPPALRAEVKERISLFSVDAQHPSLRVHKLRGALQGRWSFSVNYQYRIVFRYEKNDVAILLAVGDHGVYD